MPSECGKCSSATGSSRSPRPCQSEVVAHSPTPSMQSTAADRYGEGKKAEAACDSWCRRHSTSGTGPSPRPANSWRTDSPARRFQRTHSGKVSRKEAAPKGTAPA